MKYDNMSIVIQGPFDQYIYEEYRYSDRYKELFTEVIISCYDTDNTDVVNNGETLIKSPPPTHPHNPANMYYHAYSSLMGLREVNTEFAIKVRSDDFYYGIDKFADTIIDNPDKYVNININVSKPHISALRPSDRLIGGRTKHMMSAMENVLGWCHHFSHPVGKHTPMINMKEIPEIDRGFQANAETTFYLGYLKSVGYNLQDVEAPSNIMYETICVVDVNNMKPFVWSCHPGDSHIRHETFEWDDHHNPNVVTCTEDLYWPPRS